MGGILLACFWVLITIAARPPVDASSIQYSSFLGTPSPTGQDSSFVHIPGAPGWMSAGLPLSYTALNNGGPAEYVGGPLTSRLLYRNPVELKDAANMQPVSFSTTFVAQIMDGGLLSMEEEEQEYNVGGVEGLAFILVPDAFTVGAGGGYLGLLEGVDGFSSSATKSHTFGVEIDTLRSSELGDPGYRHVGIDVGSMMSSAVAPTPDRTFSSLYFQVWIEYQNPSQTLEIRIGTTGGLHQAKRPDTATLTSSMNLSAVLLDFMYVGFSSAVRSCSGSNSTGGCTRLTRVLAWSFETFSWDSNATVAHLPTEDSGESIASRNRRTVVASLAVLVMALTVASGLYFYFRWDNRRGWMFDLDANLEAGPHRFSYEELSIATNGFSPKQALGKGGFGSVYKGFLPGNKTEVAVKRVAQDSKQGEREFLAEVHIIGKIRHRNLVRLQGWCHEKDELLLVYDYLSGGSLDRLLFREQGSTENLQNDTVLSWENRMKVMHGIAAAVAYLHDECDQRIVHRDIKASNVLLDGKFVAKLGDFGLARSYQHSLLAPDTTAVAGTFGYLAPELFRLGKATQKSDVYSFGVFLLEVACGRRPVDPRAPEEQVVLVDWVWELFSQSRVVEAADATLCGQFDAEEMSTVVKLALTCCHSDPEARPSMRQVVMILSRDMGLPPMPTTKPTVDQPLILEDLTGTTSFVQTEDLQRSTSSTKYARLKPMEEDV